MKTYPILVLSIFLLLLSFSLADEKSHEYTVGETVKLWASQVGPHYNPQETYSYYTYPFCPPAGELEHKFPSLGEALQGIELTKSNIDIVFRQNFFKRTICQKTLDDDTLSQFLYAVTHEYWYQLYVDDLPMWAMVGGVAKEGEEKVPFIYTHKKFSIGYNGNRIVEVNLTAENPVPLKKGNQLSFTYSVTWVPSNIPFEYRFRRYLDLPFFEHKIHWFSIFNSFMMVIFLSGLVFMILVRTLRSELAKYSKDSEDGYDSDQDFTDESGWKQVHGDVFRPPPVPELFAAVIGTGWQLLVLIFLLIFISIAGSLYDSRGALMTACIISYAVTSFISGYFSGSYYSKIGGKNWIRTMLLTAGFLPGVIFICGFFLNFFAVAYGSLTAIPFGTIVAVVVIWAFITVPLVSLGTIVGRNLNGTPDHPCRINAMPRLIPQKKWYLDRWVFFILGGVLPFGSIFIEMYFIFTSFWNYKFYYVYGFMLLVFIILIIVTMCVSVVSTYFLLNSEDYRWQWTSFLASASTSLYVFAYSIYFFYAKTSMKGALQVTFYFGYMALFSFVLAVLCGTIGYVGASIFVYKIYRNIKID